VVTTSEEDKAMTEDAVVVETVIDLALDQITEGQAQIEADADPWASVQIPYDDVCERFEEMTSKEMSPHRLGHIRSRLDIPKHRYRDGTVIEGENLHKRLRTLAAENNIDWPGETTDEEPLDDSAEDLIEDIKEVLVDLQTTMETPPEREKAIDAVGTRGWPEDRIKDRVDSLYEKGEVMEPEDGRLVWTDEW